MLKPGVGVEKVRDRNVHLRRFCYPLGSTTLRTSSAWFVSVAYKSCSGNYEAAYSFLNATMGSTLAACQAGRNAAAPATSAMQPVATTKLSGSKADRS